MTIATKVANIPNDFAGYRGRYEKFTYFWKKTVFSQWHKQPFYDTEIVNGEPKIITYNCAEQYMMAAKAKLFKDEETLAKIMASDDPRTQKALGREVKNFDQNLWNENALSVVQHGNRCKFSQNEDAYKQLMATEGTLLVEASPKDQIWGIGITEENAADGQPWNGLNKLGTALTWVRESFELKEMYKKPISQWPKLPEAKKDYPKPSYTADNIIVSVPSDDSNIPEILLIKRGNDPFKGCWAIPGGFVNEGETGEQAARREGKEEIGIDLPGIPKFIGIYDRPGRDPRGWVIAGAWLWNIPHNLKELIKAGDDAAEARWFPVNDLPELAFDHAKIINDALKGYI